MKKILFYASSNEFGGAERYLLQILTGISRSKYQPVLVTENRALGAKISANMPELKYECISGMLGWAGFLRLLFFDRPDAVHFNMHVPFSCVIPIIFTAVLKVPAISATVHSVDVTDSKYPFVKPIKKNIAKNVLKMIGSFICVSKDSKKRFSENYGISPDKITVIYNGIAPENTDQQKHPGIQAAAGSGAVVGTVSRLIKNKGIEVMLNAFRMMTDSREDVSFLVVGGGRLRLAFMQQAADLGLTGRINFTGHVEDVHPFLDMMDVFVMPSLSESMPFSLMEAMSAGKPVIATDVGGVKELVFQNESGLLVPPNDPKEMFRAILALLNDPDRAVSIGNKAKERIYRDFSLSDTLSATERFFDRG